MTKENSNVCQVLLIEDDPNLGLITQESLELHGFKVTLMEDGNCGWEAFSKQSFDICIIDIMLPGMDGFTLAKKIREKDARIPIIFLTACCMKEDRIRGFKIGGDDYITKPFSMEELVLRIQAILRRVNQISSSSNHKKYVIGDYLFEYDKYLLKDQKMERKLTFREAELLRLLCEHQNQIVDRDHALNQIWGDSTFFTARSMDVYISHLRKYLREDPKIQITNIHGKGFKLIVD